MRNYCFKNRGIVTACVSMVYEGENVPPLGCASGN